MQLEDEAEQLVAHMRTLEVVQSGDVASGEQVRACVGAVQQAEDVEERRLAGPGAAGTGDPLSAADLQVEVLEHRHRDLAPPVGALQAADFEDRLVHLSDSTGGGIRRA